LSEGEHTVEATMDGYQTATRSVTVTPGEESRVELSLLPTGAVQPTAETEPQAGSRSSGLRTGAWITTGLAIALLGTAVGLYAWNAGEYNTWESNDETIRSELAEDVSDDEAAAVLLARVARHNDQGGTIGTVSTVSGILLALGATSAVTAIVLFVLAPRGEEGASVSLRPQLGGLSLTATWMTR